MRLRTTDVWHNAPGIVCAYQPVAAPDAFVARQNVSKDARQAGLYMARDGVAPTWHGAMGWTFDGTTQYLMTGVVPSAGWSALVKFSNAAITEARVAIGGRAHTDPRFLIGPSLNGIGVYYGYGGYKEIAPLITSGVLALAGNRAYRNGVLDDSNIGTWSGTAVAITIGARNWNGLIDSYYVGNIQAAAVYARTLTPAEVWQASRQMAYCDVNPEWSVWSPRRKWFPYVLAGTAAGRVGIYGARPTVALPGGVRIVPQDEGGING